MSVTRAGLPIAIAGCVFLGASAAAADGEESTAAPAPEKVLFVGNSHTERNGGLNWLIGSLVKSADPEQSFQGEIRAEKGVNLEHHYRNGAPRAISAGDFDTVVLQEYIPGSEARTSASFLEFGPQLGQEVLDAGARPVLFMTWPQERRGWADLEDFVSAHRLVAAELDADVAPVGVAFDLVNEERPDLALMDPDGVHASWPGAYLAALTVYATLFDRSPEGLAFTLGLDPDDAAFLQRVAWQAVTDWESGAA